MHTQMHASITHVHSPHASMYTNTNTHTYTHTHMYTHTHTCTHTHNDMGESLFVCVCVLGSNPVLIDFILFLIEIL